MTITPTVEGFTGHYSVNAIDSLADVRQVLGGGADDLNWLFLSTSGVHGSYLTLDDLAEPDLAEFDEDEPSTITVLVVQPRMVRCYYGDVPVTPADFPWLREQVSATLAAVEKSQRGN